MTKMRWNRYSGSRISRPGWRTSLELPATERFGPTTRRYGCVWYDGSKFFAYYEVSRPGEIEDIGIGPFVTEQEARAEVEGCLNRQYPDAMN